MTMATCLRTPLSEWCVAWMPPACVSTCSYPMTVQDGHYTSSMLDHESTYFLATPQQL